MDFKQIKGVLLTVNFPLSTDKFFVRDFGEGIYAVYYRIHNPKERNQEIYYKLNAVYPSFLKKKKHFLCRFLFDSHLKIFIINAIWTIYSVIYKYHLIVYYSSWNIFFIVRWEKRGHPITNAISPRTVGNQKLCAFEITSQNCIIQT